MFEYKARVVRVVDADTLDVIIDLGFNVLTNQRVRLLGINAAEKNTEMGKKSIDYVNAYKIIIYDDNGDLDVLDGLHRLSKSVILKRKTINVKYISNDILLKCKIKQ